VGLLVCSALEVIVDMPMTKVMREDTWDRMIGRAFFVSAAMWLMYFLFFHVLNDPLANDHSVMSGSVRMTIFFWMSVILSAYCALLVGLSVVGYISYRREHKST